MPEPIKQIKKAWPHSLLFLIPLLLLVFLVSLVLVLTMHKPEEPPPPEEPQPTPEETPPPAEPVLLVTAEQIARLTYTDSRLGLLQWELSEDALLELNQVLVKYDIITPGEIGHFLAQATVETGAGRQLTENADADYCRSHGYTVGTRGAGYLHLTHEYGQMAFSTWMMKRHVPGLENISFVNPANHGTDEVRAAYYTALQTAANLGLNVSRYSRIVYDASSAVPTGADYIAASFAWESAGYYWMASGIGDLLAANAGPEQVDAVSDLIGGVNRQSRREAYEAFYPILAASQRG